MTDFTEILKCFKQVNTSVNELSRSLNSAIQNLSKDSQLEPTNTPSTLPAPPTLDVGLLPVPNSRWKPENGDKYYFITSDAHIMAESGGISNLRLSDRYALANVYRTEEEAQAALDQQLATVRVLDRIAELNAEQGWKCDWDDHDQIKYIFRFDHDDRIFYFGSTYLSQWHQSQYYGSKQTIETVIKEMPEDCKLMLGVE